MTDEMAKQMEKKFADYLRSNRHNRSKRSFSGLRVFLRGTEPIGSMDLLYQVKREDVNVSLGAVYRTLNQLIECGLAREFTEPRPGVRQGTRFAPAELEVICGHQHLVCKDCGASVEKDANH
jgi:Fe2+ or Zn2+ uptake regulation protein